VRAVVQRVSRGSVTIGDQVGGQIGLGLVVLLGVGHGDGEAEARLLAEEVANIWIRP